MFTFEIDDVTGGAAGAGRVYTPSSGSACGHEFELGAKYLVHAEVVDPDAPYLGVEPGVDLATGLCLEGELLAAASSGDSVRLALLSTGVRMLLLIALLAGAFAYVSFRRRPRI